MRLLLLLMLVSSITLAMEQSPGPAKAIGWQNIPGDVRRLIQRSAIHAIADDNLQQTTKNVKNFVLINKDFRTFLYIPHNIIELITSIALKTEHKNEVDIAGSLKNMPGIQHAQVQQWLAKRTIEIPLEEELIKASYVEHLQKITELLCS